MGNLALSSCPGKKVRLTGASRGRAAINRDLGLDMERMRSFGITTIVCCLSDTELEYLGAPWPLYSAAAAKNNMHIIRLPMVEGSCPSSLAEVDHVINYINVVIRKGENVLTHCRGGVGRAGLIACCWLLNNLFCLSAERAIRYVRIRRSPKAIETMRQAEFVIHYSQHIGQLLEQSRTPQNSLIPTFRDDGTEKETTAADGNTASKISGSAVTQQNQCIDRGLGHDQMQHRQLQQLQMTHTDYTLSIPTMDAISDLERLMRDKDLIGYD
ncbi:protein-tyrosine phosphatase-like protein [Dichotomocladium elegans]|nr:protein-tyrosine phosphatase-like protein [Dichotomocladium elegans]KAI9315720.1 protein-tyrosine phosphatase-like protein [Dichotomocladium elegans]